MSVQLLDKIRKINKLLHNNTKPKVDFNDMCEILSEVLSSNVYVISGAGKVLGSGSHKEVKELPLMITNQVGEHIDLQLNERFLEILSTKENVYLETLGLECRNDCEYHALVSPIDIAKERLGTLFIYNSSSVYSIDDIILSEYGTGIIGLDMLRSVNEEEAEAKRKKQVVASAISTLSVSELEAIYYILKELDGVEGVLVASKVADRVGITRSVIVNALRKFESAGVIESKSSGMKGTYIKVVNSTIFEELEKLKKTFKK